MQLYWGTMQDRVYKTKVKEVEELRQRIVQNVHEWEHHVIVQHIITAHTG